MSIGNTKKPRGDPRHSLKKRLVLAVAATIAVAGSSIATAGAGAGPLKTEVIPMTCQAEWDASNGWTAIYLFAPDTPTYPTGISGNNPFTVARGTGVFTAGGQMVVVCARQLNTFPSGTTWRHELPTVSLLRGGEDFTILGARLYEGKGHVVVTRGNQTLITVVGRYVKTCTTPGCN